MTNAEHAEWMTDFFLNLHNHYLKEYLSEASDLMRESGKHYDFSDWLRKDPKLETFVQMESHLAKQGVYVDADIEPKYCRFDESN
jgi:hypothetical protein